MTSKKISIKDGPSTIINITDLTSDCVLIEEEDLSEEYESATTEEECTPEESNVIDDSKLLYCKPSCECPYSTDSEESEESKTESLAHASDVLYDTLMNEKIVDDYDDSFGDSIGSMESYEINALDPFTPKWNFGFNSHIKPINLSTEQKQEIFVVGSNRGIIYDYEKIEMRYFKGHYNRIVSASTERAGKWIATSDVGKFSTIIITETATCNTVHTIYNDTDSGATAVALSPSGKFLVSVHRCKKPLIKFWLWSFGSDEPNGIYEYTKKTTTGVPKKISFHPNDERYIMIAFDKQILFIKWDENSDALMVKAPAHRTKHSTSFTDCTMMVDCHECFASTTDGTLQLYGNANYIEKFCEHEIDNNKTFVKEIKVSSHPIVFLQSTEQILVSIDGSGKIQCYNQCMLLLYWYTSPFATIRYMMFNLNPRKYKIIQPFDMQCNVFSLDCPIEYLPIESRVDSYELLYKNVVPSVASLNRSPFIVRPCLIECANGGIYEVDLVKMTHKKITEVAESAVAYIDCSDELPYIVISYVDGRISLYNYETTGIIISIPKIKGASDKPLTTCKFLYQSTQLAVGMKNGEMWFLNIILQPNHTTPYNFTDNEIVKIIPSYDLQFCAFYDKTNAVYLLIFEDSTWRLLGKNRSHYDTIRDMMFTNETPTKLLSIGQDRYLVEYYVDPEVNELIIKSRIKVEQSAKPICFLDYPTPPGSDHYFLIGNSEHKYKMIREEDRMCRSVALGPAHACYEEGPVERIVILPCINGKYMIFSNGFAIGIQKMPPDGSPYRYIAVKASRNLGDFALSRCGNYIFTFSLETHAVFMWTINTKSADTLQQFGGAELSPYYCLIEGGESGWFFKEMMDLFCYMQILHQGDSYQTQNFTDQLAVTELPDLLRTCGYFASDFEIEEAMNDIMYRDFAATGKLRDTIKFPEFVKLFVNHKPPNGISYKKLKEKFTELFGADSTSSCWSLADEFTTVQTEKFMEYLQSYGEPFSEDGLEKCLKMLMRKRTGTDETQLPPTMDINFLTDDILGILRTATVYEEQQEKEARSKVRLTTSSK